MNLFGCVRRGAGAALASAVFVFQLTTVTLAQPPEVRLRASGAGNYLTDARGMTLYTYAQDTQPGASACAGDCAKAWPPLRSASGAKAVGDWSLIARDDGAPQWAWRGRPLYTFAKDNYAGGLLGDGVGNAWRVALDPIPLPPGFALRHIYLGRVLTDARGRTLYWRSDEIDGSTPTSQSKCRADCLSDWSMVVAPWLAQARGDWSLLASDDGQKQWAFRGRRLYAHTDDLRPGDAFGHGASKVWSAAILDPAPPLPAWVTVQNSDWGEVYADQRGLTLYTFAGQLERTKKLMCDAACIERFWRTVPAQANSRPGGDFTPIASPDGKGRVWAFKGNVLYTHTRDREPGAIGGDKWAAGVGGGGGGWLPIPRRRDFEE